MRMRTKVLLLVGLVVILVVAVLVLLSVNNKAQEPAITQPIATASVPRRIVIFMGPMRPVNTDFETETFASAVSILDADGDQTVVYYQPQDFSLDMAGQSIKNAEISRSNNKEWISVSPTDSLVEISIGDKALSLSEDDVLMFNLSGQHPNPSIVMEVWRDGLFTKQNMNVFFEESSYQPVQRIPNWILDILSA